jgi:hypothetical protein
MNTHDPTNGNGAEHNPMPSPKPSTVCGAKCRNGRTCTQKPMPNGRCRLHGGKTPAGIASPHWRHGRRSKYEKHLPKEMRNGYLAALKGFLSALPIEIRTGIQCPRAVGARSSEPGCA